jgi:cell division protein FtsW
MGMFVLTRAGVSTPGHGLHIPGSIIIASFWFLHFFLILHKEKGDELFLPASALLIGLGWMEIFRLSPELAFKQMIWILIGEAVFVLWLCLVRDYRVLEDYKYLFLVGAVILQGAVAVVGHEVNGARLWFRLGFFSFQPVEIVKIFVTVFLAAYLKQNREILEKPLLGHGAGTARYYVPLFVLWGLAESVLIIEKDLGMALLLFGVFLGLFYVTTRKGWLTALGLLIFLGASFLLYHVFSHVRVRIDNWLNPWADPEGRGYQMIQALYSLANGGILGTGLGLGKPYYIPAVSTDYIFVALAEETGLLGAFVILILFVIIIQRMFRSALSSGDYFSVLLSTGLGLLFATQVFIIVGGAVKLIPLTGITLPFVSYGGSSLVSNFILLGLFMQISGRAFPERHVLREKAGRGDTLPHE